ncbi:MAG: flagellar biosynthesis protein FlhF [Ignavibacteriaceae bacterium]
MQIKKFFGPTLKDATVQMKEELGSEAIILGSRLIEDVSEFGKRKMFEITVGYDEKAGHEAEETEEELEADPSFVDEIALLTKKVYPSGKETNNRSKVSKAPVPDNRVENDKKPQLFEGVFPGINKKPEFNLNQKNIEQEIKEISDLLVHREISKPLTSVILNQLDQYKKILHESNIDSYVLSSIASMIPTKNFELYKDSKPKVVSVVGPTGVGKTTCIAKLAVIAKILHNLDVGLISVDTYRLGAIDQLRIFSEISNIDMLVAYEPEEMPELLKSFKDKDLVFIDTAGRSQKNSEHLARTKMYLDKIKIDETFLVLSATNSTKNLFDTAEKFKSFNYNSFIFTKIDEGVAFGNLLNTITNFNLPVTFLSNGQVIPDDIISADSEFIANLIFTGKIGK